MKQLENFIASGRIPHALCFVGADPEYLSELSEYTARLFLCGNGQAAPCDTCKSCKKAQNKSHPDIIRASELTDGGKYKVDALRKIAVDSVVRPNDGDFKVYIFAKVDSMTPLCQNTLLKFTEEPPEYVRIIFTASSPDTLLDTIKSRLVFINADSDTVAENNTELLAIAHEFIAALIKSDEYRAAAALSRIKTREDLSETLNMISGLMHNSQFTARSYVEAQKFLLDCIDDLKFNPNIALACTHITAGICEKLKI
ncbi:MAG: DNA polymerase III subunit [Oscillospiraceae bacterium]|jgi:DNA polymerase III delta prime subunit|nr:DNA polymerase III subunit [Oscillospiraceae bacterium]